MVLGVFMHHGLSTGAFGEDKSIYPQTLVSKAFSLILRSQHNRYCPLYKKYFDLNDHLGCKYFHSFDDKVGMVVCALDCDGCTIEKEAVESAKEGVKVTTEIDKVASLIKKHRKLKLDVKLSNHLNTTPKRLRSHLNTLENYGFVKTHMDPREGMVITWDPREGCVTKAGPNAKPVVGCRDDFTRTSKVS